MLLWREGKTRVESCKPRDSGSQDSATPQSRTSTAKHRGEVYRAANAGASYRYQIQTERQSTITIAGDRVESREEKTETEGRTAAGNSHIQRRIGRADVRVQSASRRRGPGAAIRDSPLRTASRDASVSDAASCLSPFCMVKCSSPRQCRDT
jgi:hypothetical protein